MGNSQTVYIIGEVDFRAVRLDRLSSLRTNLCLRYTHISKDRPTKLSVNYESSLSINYFWIENLKGICSNGMDLRKNNQTRIVLLEGKYNYLTGYSNLKVLESKIVPITKRYALK